MEKFAQFHMSIASLYREAWFILDILVASIWLIHYSRLIMRNFQLIRVLKAEKLPLVALSLY